MSQSNDNACKSSAYHGCGASTQISGSISGHLNFLAPAPTSRGFWLPFRDNGLKNQKKIVLFAQLACPTNYRCGSGTQISSFGSTSWKFLTPTPAIQNCFNSGSTGLLRTRLIHISPTWWTIYRSFEIILERELSIRLEVKSNVLYKSIASKNFQSDVN